MKILCKLDIQAIRGLRVIKGQVFCGQWTGDKKLNITV